MRSSIEINIQIDPACREPVVVIRTDRKNREVENIIRAIENCADSGSPMLAGYLDNTMELLSQRDVVRVYVEARKVRIRTEKETYEFRKSLSYLEQLLNPDRFFRISRFEIVNVRKIASFDFSMAGTVHIRFDDGSVTWAARRYVKSIQLALEQLEKGKEE